MKSTIRKTIMNKKQLYQKLKKLNPFLPHAASIISGPCKDCHCGLKDIHNNDFSKQDLVEILNKRAKECQSYTDQAIEDLMNNPKLKATVSAKEFVHEITNNKLIENKINVIEHDKTPEKV